MRARPRATMAESIANPFFHDVSNVLDQHPLQRVVRIVDGDLDRQQPEPLGHAITHNIIQ